MPVKCKFLILFNQILVSDATKQMTHDGLVWNVDTRAMPSCWHFNFGMYICHTRHHASFV